MTRSTTEVSGPQRGGHERYTVICKSGQRGIGFSDARLAALAFLQAQALDGPFVLRHQGCTSHVIASAKTGTKRIEPGGRDDSFRNAFESIAHMAETY